MNCKLKIGKKEVKEYFGWKLLATEVLNVKTELKGIPYVNCPEQFNSFKMENFQCFDAGELEMNNKTKKIILAVILQDEE